MTPILSFEPFVSTAKESPAYWLLDILWVVHATGEQTQGRYSIIEQWMPHGVGPPPHVHAFEDEVFWVMEGEMTAEVGGKTLVLGPGAMGHIPRNTVHAFKVTSKEVCHVLNYYTPAGFEQALVGCARPAARRELPPRDWTRRTRRRWCGSSITTGAPPPTSRGRCRSLAGRCRNPLRGPLNLHVVSNTSGAHPGRSRGRVTLGQPQWSVGSPPRRAPRRRIPRPSD
jgi:mannose-6-phosphate isomerase-like protein (cupin superfamily)